MLSKVGWDIDVHTKKAKVNLWEEEDPGVRPIILYNAFGMISGRSPNLHFGLQTIHL